MKKIHIILITFFCICFSDKSSAQSAEWNLDFEEWDYYDTTPGLWHDTTVIENRVGLFPPRWHYRPDHIPERTGLGQTTDATHGDYAVTLSGFYGYQVMRIIAGESAEKPGWAIDFKPFKLLGDYKVILLGTGCDSLRAYVDVFLTTYNSSSGSRDTIGQGNVILKETSNLYQQFDVNINYQDNFTIPDTVIIVLAKERFGFDAPPECLECSHVFFDNLELTTTLSAQKSEEKDKGFEIFPNPTKGSFVIRSNNKNDLYDMSILSPNGQLIQAYWNIKNETKIDMDNLAKGLYFIRIENKTSAEFTYHKIIIQ